MKSVFRFMRCFLLSLVVLATVANAADTAKAPLLAGAATSNITPALGGDIVGGFLPFPATHIHDELHARCLVLDDGKSKLAFVVCDLLGLHRSVSVEARKLIEEETGIPAANVLISGTHTHSATSTLGGTPRSHVSDMELTDYQKFVARRIADGVRRAVNVLRPAEIAFGTVEAPEHVFIRRWFLKEGAMPPNPFGKIDKVKMNPGAGNANLVEPAGEPDPTVSFIALREPGGRLISVFSAYSLHYVGGVGSGHISADYYGMYCEALKDLQKGGSEDPPFVALMANGTSGDANNINFRTPRPGKPPYAQMRHVADDLAAKVNGALANVTWQGSAPLASRYRELGIAWRKIDPELIAWAKETEKSTPRIQGKADLPLAYAARVQRLAQPSPETKAPVQILRIGDVCIGTTPCETFAETGLEFKKRSPFPKSFMVELAHGYYGYMPTPRHFELGGYETWPGTNNLEPQASVKMMDALLEMAAEVKEPAK
ncbi:MAG TPA: neutral/alkaline non-lysosomal ceramidase N-terminal domain-containing protein [Candidatus Saccharimonadia bacterium]|nr:neutral/alkaline non-lysosomal ceramidase N-terminal domain-containing protein [Candidatus Saccharimonadia bacterium]